MQVDVSTGQRPYKHTANLTREWFNKKEINVLQWPKPIPIDLNQIENLWGTQKNKIRQKSLRNLAKLKDWANISPQGYERLISSNENRLRVVIMKKGYATKY